MELLGKWHRIYSYCPQMIIVGDLMGLSKVSNLRFRSILVIIDSKEHESTTVSPHVPIWRFRRKLKPHILSISAISKYHFIQADLDALLCRDIMERLCGSYPSIRRKYVVTAIYRITANAVDSQVSTFLSLSAKTFM
jgi:hypothetical protein